MKKFFFLFCRESSRVQCQIFIVQKLVCHTGDAYHTSPNDNGDFFQMLPKTVRPKVEEKKIRVCITDLFSSEMSVIYGQEATFLMLRIFQIPQHSTVMYVRETKE